MTKTYEEKVQTLNKIFESTKDSKDRYKLIMKLGSELEKMQEEFLTEINKVSGCQSMMYLTTFLKDGKLCFYAHSDALISKGLAAILILVYQDLTIETFLKSPPEFVKELDLLSALSFNRSNGFASIYQKMKEQVFKLLIKK